MADGETGDNYLVVRNGSEQYSVWRTDRAPPGGWKDVRKTGTREECLAYVEEAWTDMRPLGVRLWMQESAGEYP
jgi:MbtH protein